MKQPNGSFQAQISWRCQKVIAQIGWYQLPQLSIKITKSQQNCQLKDTKTYYISDVSTAFIVYRVPPPSPPPQLTMPSDNALDTHWITSGWIDDRGLHIAWYTFHGNCHSLCNSACVWTQIAIKTGSILTARAINLRDNLCWEFPILQWILKTVIVDGELLHNGEVCGCHKDPWRTEVGQTLVTRSSECSWVAVAGTGRNSYLRPTNADAIA